MWVDYVSLRPCQKGDWDPAVVVELVADLGVVVAAIDYRMLFLSRSWCVFEIYCAARAVLEHGGHLHCPIESGWRYEAKKALLASPVDSAAAQCSNDEDAETINGFIKKHLGSNADLDRMVTEALLRSNDILAKAYVDGKGEYIRAEDEDGDDGADLWEPVYDEHGGFSFCGNAKYRRFVDGYKSVWEYDDQHGKGTYEWVSREPTAEEDAHWDPVLGEDGKVVRNRWRYEGEEGEGKWVYHQ